MRLSEPLLASLRTAQQDRPALERSRDEPVSTPPVRSRSHQQYSHAQRLVAAQPMQSHNPLRSVSHAGPRFDSLEERFRTPLHPAATRLLDELSDGATELPSPDEVAMQAFHQTMQAFLQTQQEVMSAYLRVSPDALADCPPHPGDALASGRCEAITAAPATSQGDTAWSDLARMSRASGASSRVTSGTASRPVGRRGPPPRPRP